MVEEKELNEESRKNAVPESATNGSASPVSVESRVKMLLSSHLESWLEVENDPGVFSLIIEDMGANGIAAETVFDLSTVPEETVYGVIYMAPFDKSAESLISMSAKKAKEKKTPGRKRKGARESESVPVETEKGDSKGRTPFFLKQTVRNSCASHALLHVLLNIDEKEAGVDLGPILPEFRRTMTVFDENDRGQLLCSFAPIVMAHNRHARYSQLSSAVDLADQEVKAKIGKKARSKYFADENSSSDTTDPVPEQFHYSSFVPLDGRVFEINGLADHPTDVGRVPSNTNWLEFTFQLITKRLEECQSEDTTVMIIKESDLARCRRMLKQLTAERDSAVRAAEDAHYLAEVTTEDLAEISLISCDLDAAENFDLHIETRDGQPLKVDKKNAAADSDSPDGKSAAYEFRTLEEIDKDIEKTKKELAESENRFLDVLKADDRSTHNYGPFFAKFIKFANESRLYAGDSTQTSKATPKRPLSKSSATSEKKRQKK
uniref:ubiquitinyl hydrolase 1 n=1 Tax=Plectus sambesii TaxID=2011161 RepID=A0A914VX49_9BILA